MKALNRAKWNNRKVVVEVSCEEGGKGHESGSGERKGGKRFGKGEERAPRHENKDRKSKIVQPEIQNPPNPARKRNQAVLNVDTQTPVVRRRRTTGRHFSRIRNLTSAKKDGHAESRRISKKQST